MKDDSKTHEASRRAFLKNAALCGGGAALASVMKNVANPFVGTAGAAQGATPDWTKQMGLELFTVRDMVAKDYEGTLAKVAEIGYKEIEPASGYGNMEPKAFKAMLDRLGLSMPSTHSGAAEGPDLEKQLEGFQIMGIQYAGISSSQNGAGRGGAGRGPGGAPPPTTPKGGMDDRRQYRLGMGAGSGPLTMARVETVDDVKRTAAEYNRHGAMAKKFGIKMLIHNHTGEFQPCKDSDLTPEEIMITETDPELVVIQLDIGWASVAGQDVVGLFKKHPGRFVLWHVKDAQGISKMTPDMDQNARMLAATVVPVGEGEVDYKTIFSYAELAGMKHFCVEQDSAAAWGDSIAAARVSYQNLLLDVA
jgi:sugar phosphate isomerase/epimerase